MEGVKKKSFIFYGKGGIGKSTVAINLGIALMELNNKVMVVGCSPKSNVMDLYKGNTIESTILDISRQEELNADTIKKAIMKTAHGMIITETGGPKPGIGCAGRGLPVALESLSKYKDAIEGYDEIKYIIYDVIGDVVCGGFATPMRQPGPRKVFIVTSGELMSLYAANNIVKAVCAIGDPDVKVGGYIANLRGIPKEEEVIEAFSKATQVPVLVYIPRDSNTFKKAETLGGPVLEVLPDSYISDIFRKLSKDINENPRTLNPTPIDDYNNLFDMFMSFQKSEYSVKGDISHDYIKRIPANTVKREELKRISIYGTGGIGKSTVSSNISASLVLLGERVYQIGCDPKRDSISTLCGGIKQTVLDELRRVNKVTPDLKMMKELVFEARDYNGRLYGTECGGPRPGKGCAGKGVHLALQFIEKYNLFKEFDITFVLYDVLGDTVCGGFATPLNFTPQTYIVTSGEVAPMVQAMKIVESVMAKASEGSHDVGIAGIINNMREIEHEKEIVEEVFGEIGLPVIHHIPRSQIVQEAENLKRTVVQSFPGSDQANEYLELARKILNNEDKIIIKKRVLNSLQIKNIVSKYK